MTSPSQTLSCVEGKAFAADFATRTEIKIAFNALKRVLRFRSWPLTNIDDDKLSVNGVIGIISLPSGRTLEIVPKTEPNEDWIASVLDLLLGRDRIDAAGARTGGLSPERRAVLPWLAAIYASRLQDALLRDGPLLLLKGESRSRTALRGKLETSTWLRHASHRPHIFPTLTTNLTADNGFAGAMANVAGQLAKHAGSPNTRRRLLEARKALRPGLPLDAMIAPGIEMQKLPVQWAAYEPSWKIATAILSRRSLLGSTGRREAVSIAIEGWPLLERLLLNALRSAAQQYNSRSTAPARVVHGKPKQRILLTGVLGTSKKDVAPDAWVEIDGSTRATFDAKYKLRDPAGSWPAREDYFQVLCTASAFRSPLAVLVYPEQFEPESWDVPAMGGFPARIVAVGLGLYSYTSGKGDTRRGQVILDLLKASNVSYAVDNS